MKLRYYQQDAVNAVLRHLKKSVEPCVLELATGAGKSLIVAELAKFIQKKSGKRVLCLAPSKELTEQNFNKYTKEYGEKASYFSASLGKSMRFNTIFGTPISVKNSINKFTKGDFASVIIDEAHGITPTLTTILTAMLESNPKLRVIGMTATPYRLNSGYIYKYGVNNSIASDCEPYFHSKVYEIQAEELIAAGYLTPPLLDPKHFTSYDTSNISKHTQAEYEQVFEGQGRKTASIIQDIVKHAAMRKGVMVFSATVKHAQECLESLPDGSRIVIGDTNSKEREQIISDFKQQKFKYLVSVGTLTTGFDASHVDVIAVLRSTKSAGLFQQIIGRGTRLHKDKKNFLVLDYANNVEEHKLFDSIFKPNVKNKSKKESALVSVACSVCFCINEFSSRYNPEEFEVSPEGYFIDLAGNILQDQNGLEVPSHYGRRCCGYIMQGLNSYRCEHRWSSKECPECKGDNDIAARYCEHCKAELIDPNEKLHLDFVKMKQDPHTSSTNKVLSASWTKWVSKAGNNTIKVMYVTDYHKFTAWYQPKASKVWRDFCYETTNKIFDTVEEYADIALNSFTCPKTLTYSKRKSSDFFKVQGHNRDEDSE